jgi:hypothetical protein
MRMWKACRIAGQPALHQRLAQGREQGGIVNRDIAPAFDVGGGKGRAGSRGDAVDLLLATLPMFHQLRAERGIEHALDQKDRRLELHRAWRRGRVKTFEDRGGARLTSEWCHSAKRLSSRKDAPGRGPASARRSFVNGTSA